MKVLLIRPETPSRPACRFPLGLGYIAAVLHSAGHEVKVLDLDVVRWKGPQVEEFIKYEKYDIFAISGLAGHYKDMKRLMSASKRHHPSAVIMCGGAGFSSMPRIFMDNTECDIGVLREGEETAVEVLDALSSGRPLGAVSGIFYKDRDGIKISAPRHRIKNLDALPFPKWDLFPMNEYLKQQLFESRKNDRAVSMVGSRGCPFSCTFCFRDFGRETFIRSVDNVISEIKQLKDRYDVNYVSFVDELFTCSDKHVNKFCDRILDEKIKIRWDCRGRVDLVNAALLKKMKAAGCAFMSFGIESANETVLKNMRKQITVSAVKNAVDLTRKSGIKVSGSFMIGMLGETRASLQETVDFIKDIGMHKNYGFFYTTPFPGTELFDKALEMGAIKDIVSYIESLGETHRPYINLTGIDDRTYSALKKNADDEIRADYKAKHPFWIIEESLAFYAKNGFVKTVKKAVKKILNKK